MQPFTTTLCVAVCLFGLSDTELRAGAKKAPDPKDITEIIVQRKSGPAPPTKGDVHLRRPDEPAYEFDRLATWLVRNGFFALKERYEPDHKPADADYVVLTVVHGEQRKTAVNYAGAGNRQTWEFEMMIRGVAADLANRRARSERGGDGKARRPQEVSTAAATAAMAGLNACFVENWGDGPIFVERGPLIPAGLNRVGRYAAEVVSETDLERRFEGQPLAPSMARVRVVEEAEKDRKTYTVSVSYSGLLVKGAERIPLGGGRWYKYTVDAGVVRLVAQGTEEY